MHVTKGKWKLIFIDLSDLNLWHRRAQQTYLVDKRGVFFHISSEKVWAEPLDPGARGWTRRHCQRNEKYFSSNRFYLICKSTLVLFSGGQLKWRCHLIGRWRQSFQFPAAEAVPWQKNLSSNASKWKLEFQWDWPSHQKLMKLSLILKASCRQFHENENTKKNGRQGVTPGESGLRVTAAHQYFPLK